MPGTALDPRIAPVVAALNALPGVETRASCQGCGQGRSRAETHATQAYVLFARALPVGLEAWLLQELGALARVEADRLYARDSRLNEEFCRVLHAVADRYRRALARRVARRLCLPTLGLLDTLLAVVGAPGAPGAGLCLRTGAIRRLDRSEGDGSECLPLCPPAARLTWFEHFLALPPNRLDPELRAREPVERLLERAESGRFGPTFRRRWRRFARASAWRVVTHGLRDQVRAVRERGALPGADWYRIGSFTVVAWEVGRPS